MTESQSPDMPKRKKRKTICAIITTILWTILLFGKIVIAIPLSALLEFIFPGIVLTHLQLDFVIVASILIFVVLPIIIFKHNGNPWKFIVHTFQKLKNLWKPD